MKRLLSIILAVLMLISVSAFAEMSGAGQMSQEAIFNRAISLLKYYNQPESIQQSKDMFANLPGSYNLADYYEIYAQIILDLNNELYEDVLGQLDTLKEFNGYAAFDVSLQDNLLPSCDSLYVYTQARQAESEERYADAYELYKKTDFMDSLERAIDLRNYKATPEPEPTPTLTPEPTPTPTPTPIPKPTTNPRYFEYEISNGECTITGYTGSDTEIVIPAEIKGYRVTSIGELAFMECESLTSITIPDTVTSIGIRAFERCTSLTSITIPDTVTFIGNEAFHFCTSLTSITIPDTVTSIGDHAFLSCKSLTSITIPDTVTSSGKYAFSGCTSLTSITIPDTVTYIGGYVFYGCTSLTSITIPDTVTYIGDYAFADCESLTSITIPDTVTSIGHGAFLRCLSLTSITIPDTVTFIGDYAFAHCESLKSITIPDTVTSIGDYALDGRKSLTIYCEAGSYAEEYARQNDKFLSHITMG